MMISSVKAKKMLRKGCTEYLAHMMNKVDESVSSFQNAFIIVKFQVMFLDNLPRLTPTEEVKFSIELSPGTVPISKALYYMTPTEL